MERVAKKSKCRSIICLFFLLLIRLQSNAVAEEPQKYIVEVASYEELIDALESQQDQFTIKLTKTIEIEGYEELYNDGGSQITIDTGEYSIVSLDLCGDTETPQYGYCQELIVAEGIKITGTGESRPVLDIKGNHKIYMEGVIVTATEGSAIKTETQEINLFLCQITAEGTAMSGNSMIIDTSKVSGAIVGDIEIIEDRFLSSVIESADETLEIYIERGTPLEALTFVSRLEVSLKRASDEYDLYFYYLNVEWDKSTYDANRIGVYEIKGQWILPFEEAPIRTENLIPTIKVHVMEALPPTLPDKVENYPDIKLHLGYYLYGTERGELWESIDGEAYALSKHGRVVIPPITFEEPFLWIRNLEKDHIYRFKLNITQGIRTGISNEMMIDTHLETVIPPPDTGEGDSSSGGDRGNSDRNTQKPDSIMTLTGTQVAILNLANEEGTTLVVDGIKVRFSKEGLRLLKLGQKDKLILQGKKISATAFEIDMAINHQKIDSLEKQVEIRLPYATNLSKKIVVASRAGKILRDSYYDEKNKEIVIRTNTLGRIEILEIPIKTYIDTSNHWAKDAITFVSSRNIAQGYGDGTFQPDQYISVGEFKKLWGVPLSEQESTMITRKEGALLIYHQYKNESVSPGQSSFTDISELSKEEQNAIAFVEQSRIMNGVSKNIFSPDTLLTRAQAAQIMKNMVMRGV